MSLARGARAPWACAVSFVRVACPGSRTASGPWGAPVRLYSTPPEPRRGVLHALQSRANDWYQRTRPAAEKRISELSQRWNEFSGYGEIEGLKAQVDVEKLQEEKNLAKSIYIQAVADRSAAQRRTSDLLTRKPSWNDADLVEYTKLLHSEHSLAKAEEQSEQKYEEAEGAMHRGFDDLMRSVMNRYHEEHLWSDRVRSVSTYVSVGLAILNVLVFMLALLLFEPYKRRKLALTLEQRLIQGEEEARERMAAAIVSVDRHLERLEGAITGKTTSDASAEHLAAEVDDKEALAQAPVAKKLPPPAPRRIFPTLPNFAWVREVVHWFAVLREHTEQFVSHYLPFSHSEQVSLAAGTTGVVLASALTYWASLFFL